MSMKILLLFAVVLMSGCTIVNPHEGFIEHEPPPMTTDKLWRTNDT